MNEIINLYSLAHNNPVNNFDENGEGLPGIIIPVAVVAAYMSCMSAFYLYANSNYTNGQGYSDKFRHCYVMSFLKLGTLIVM